MVNEDQSVYITDLLLGLKPTGERRSPFSPTVHAGTLHVSTAAFRHIVSTIMTEEIDIPVGRLSFVDCGWQPGGAWLTLRVRSLIQQNVTLKASLGAAPSGNLQILMLDVRAGMLPLKRLLDPVLDQVARRPGFIRTGPMELELNINDLLQSRDVPIIWTARVNSVRTDLEMMILDMGQ